MLLGTLGASLLGHLLTGKGPIQVQSQLEQARIFNATSSFNTFNDVYSVNNLPKIKDGAYVINLDEFKSIETHWIALHVNGNDIMDFDSL